MADLRTPSFDAVMALLKGSSTLQAFLGTPARVYDQRPSMATFPYLTMNLSEVRDVSAKGLSIESGILQIDIWSRQRGSREVTQLLAALRSVLHDATLPNIARCMEEFSSVLWDDEAQMSHGVARYRVVMAG